MKYYKYHMRMAAYILLLLVVAATACKKTAAQAPNVARGMEIMSVGRGATYTLVINGEPVSYLDGDETTLLIGYPIHGGTNQYSITVGFQRDFQEQFHSPPMISMSIMTQESVTGELDSTLWVREDAVSDVSEGWTVEGTNSYESDFVMQDIGAKIEFDPLGTNKEAYVAQCKLMSIKLADLIRRQDCSQLASVFGVRADSFATNYAPSIRSTNAYQFECIVDPSKLSVMTGDHLVLICASAGSHLVSFTRNTARKTWSHNRLAEIKHEGAYYFDSFVFGRLGGKWKFAFGGAGWQNLDVDHLLR